MGVTDGTIRTFLLSEWGWATAQTRGTLEPASRAIRIIRDGRGGDTHGTAARGSPALVLLRAARPMGVTDGPPRPFFLPEWAWAPAQPRGTLEPASRAIRIPRDGRGGDTHGPAARGASGGSRRVVARTRRGGAGGRGGS